MAESTLSVTLTTLRAQVCSMLDGRDEYSALSAERQRFVDAIIQTGYRDFLYPSLPDGKTHQWSFLKPTTTLTTQEPYSTGTIAATDGVVTLTSGTFPSWAASGSITVGGTSYSVNTRDSGTQVTLDDTTVDITSGSSYVLDQRDYDLPDDFGGMDGPITYDPGEAQFHVISIVSEEVIRIERQMGYTSVTRPRAAAIRPKTTDGSTGQRYVLMLWPAPNAQYILHYRYDVYPNDLTETYPYPYGGSVHGQTLLESVLAAAEREGDDRESVHSQRFERRLLASVDADKKKFAADHYGFLDERSNYRVTLPYARSRSLVTYQGSI